MAVVPGRLVNLPPSFVHNHLVDGVGANRENGGIFRVVLGPCCIMNETSVGGKKRRFDSISLSLVVN